MPMYKVFKEDYNNDQIKSVLKIAQDTMSENFKKAREQQNPLWGPLELQRQALSSPLCQDSCRLH